MNEKTVEKISLILDEDLLLKIEIESKKRNLKKAEFIVNILKNYFVENEKEDKGNITTLESVSQVNSENINDGELEMADFGAYKFKRTANKLNGNWGTLEREEIENEYLRLLREKKRKEHY